ncbi:glycoside hydrolase family 25 protein [Lactarius vividus]|nr:glycoside hydrolase family 25 protein [Lactarius vividus]
MRPFFQILALSTLSLSLGVAGAPAPGSEDGPTLVKRADPEGIDVSHWQGALNWNTIKSQGVTFAYIKATEGTTFIDPNFSSNYVGATNAGLIRGAYHFAHPDSSSGATQANYFLAHGGGWSGDGITLPGAIDLEAGCYGLTHAQMVTWIKDFSNTYHSKTTRALLSSLTLLHPSAIYTTTSWWTSCTGNSASFGTTNPLWIRPLGKLHRHPPRRLEYADSGPHPGDQDKFNGDAAGLKRYGIFVLLRDLARYSYAIISRMALG